MSAESTPKPIRQACILVGGKGTRLGALTRSTPKPLMAIGDDTVFLDLLIGQLASHAFDDIILLAGYLGDAVTARYHGRTVGGSRIRVIVEPEARGTAGALVAARSLLAPQFMMLNGDSFFDVDLRALCAAFGAAECEALIALHQVPDASRYGSVALDGERIIKFFEKKEHAGPALINAGIYVLRAETVERVQALPCSMEIDIFPHLVAEHRLYGRPCEGYFIDIGLPESLQKARRDLSARLHRPA